MRILTLMASCAVGMTMIGNEAQAASAPVVEFSTEVVRTDAKNPERSTRGRMFVSSHGVRTEGETNGQRVMMLYNPAEKVVWMLFPEQKGYLRYDNVHAARPPLPDEPNSPCRTRKDFICQNKGVARLSGRETTLWDISIKQGDKEIQHSSLWVDPRLRVVIREEYSDGITVEMLNIQEGVQPAELYRVPTDYQKIVTETPADKGGKPGVGTGSQSTQPVVPQSNTPQAPPSGRGRP